MRTGTRGITEEPNGTFRVAVQNIFRRTKTYSEALAVHAKLHAEHPRKNVAGRTTRFTTDGYILLYRPDHPMSNVNGYVLEHRLVMADVLGHALDPKWVVHHRLECEGGSGDILDNRPENLVVFATHSLHRRWHSCLALATSKGFPSTMRV